MSDGKNEKIALHMLEIKRYQCPGCIYGNEINGNDITCYEKRDHLGCVNHTGFLISGDMGSVFFGMPNGFNIRGMVIDLKIKIFNFEDFNLGFGYSKSAIPVWKYLDEYGNTLVRGLCPKNNRPFLHIFIGDCMDKIDCLEITHKDIEEMD